MKTPEDFDKVVEKARKVREVALDLSQRVYEKTCAEADKIEVAAEKVLVKAENKADKIYDASIKIKKGK
jgi:hypothetical protein